MKLIDERLREEFIRLEKEGLTENKKASVGVFEGIEIAVIQEYLGKSYEIKDGKYYWEGFQIILENDKNLFECTGEAAKQEDVSFRVYRDTILRALNQRDALRDQLRLENERIAKEVSELKNKAAIQAEIEALKAEQAKSIQADESKDASFGS